MGTSEIPQSSIITATKDFFHCACLVITWRHLRNQL